MPPPEGSLKLNFDEALKGIPGSSRAGGVFHNAEGKIVSLFASKLGHNTNNGVELEGLVRGLATVVEQGYKSLIVEGHSLLLISALRKLLNGSHPEKISKNWRLSFGLSKVGTLTTAILVIIPTHVRRSANAVADYLASAGVTQPSQHNF